MLVFGVVLLLVGWGLIDVQVLKGFWKFSCFEFSFCLLIIVGVFSVGVLLGIFVVVSIVVLCLFYYIYCLSDVVFGWMYGIDGQVELVKYLQVIIFFGLVIYCFDVFLLFFNVDYFKQWVFVVVDGSEWLNVVLFNVEVMINFDISGLVIFYEV